GQRMEVEFSAIAFARRGLAAALVLPILFASGCGTKATPAGPPPAPPPAMVTAVTVITKQVPVYIDQIGKCASPEIVAVRPQASGQLLKIGFTEGADVHVGQPLFTIDPAPYKAALDQANADEEINTAA